jgi:hypothetical protein
MSSSTSRALNVHLAGRLTVHVAAGFVLLLVLATVLGLYSIRSAESKEASETTPAQASVATQERPQTRRALPQVCRNGCLYSNGGGLHVAEGVSAQGHQEATLR